MTHVTEQALEEAKQALRAELSERIDALNQELGVQILEAHNRTAGITLEDVQREITAIPKPTPGLSVEDIEAMIGAAVENLSAPVPGLTTAEVEQLITDALPAEQPVPDPGLTSEDVETMITGITAYDDDELKGRILRLKVYSNELADRIGAPRMEG